MERIDKKDMFDRAQELYNKEKMNKDFLRLLVRDEELDKKMYITEQQYEQITGEKY